MRKLNCMTKVCGVFLLWATAAIALPAQTFESLYSFHGSPGGNWARGGVVQGTDGNLYGTTLGGGTSEGYCQGTGDCGTVFKITPGGALTTIYNSCSLSDCMDGFHPQAGLVQGTDGNFYGTTYSGGDNSACTVEFGCGTVFKITPSGTLTTLHSFDYTDRANPYAGLVQGTDGNFYGTTVQGGANETCDGGRVTCGTVFKITPGGTLTTLQSFNGPDGYYPQGGLVQGTDGSFYGTTAFGGAGSASCADTGCGTVFSITSSGTLTTLYSFCPGGHDCSDGARPFATLVEGTDGRFYGTTYYGGVFGNSGTVFRITPDGSLATLYRFCSQDDCTDGESPNAALVQGTDGNLYGTTINGGAFDGCFAGDTCGTVFKITPSGTLTTLHSFDGSSGEDPYSGLIQDTNGAFYGTTYFGGTSSDGGCGTVFSLSVGLRPFVETQPTSGTVGTTVNILGTDLIGATSVTFDGTAAVFTVISQSLITTSVPTGASSGKVEVTVPSGMLSSNVPFAVN
jgi:uncharacterized repeat protein (TIGR03803 family)